MESFSRARGRSKRALIDELMIQESRGAVPEAQATAELLAEKAVEAGIERFIERDKLDQFLSRIEFAGFEPPDIQQALRELCFGILEFRRIERCLRNFISILERKVGTQQLNRGSRPNRSDCKVGRQTKIHYEHGKSPWIASRLQDFFGMRETPRIGPGHTPVVVHLLAPNHRPVQTTTDLAGFWERLYPNSPRADAALSKRRVASGLKITERRKS